MACLQERPPRQLILARLIPFAALPGGGSFAAAVRGGAENHVSWRAWVRRRFEFPKERRQRDGTKAASRIAILEAARRVAARDGARDLCLRGVAAEAGFAPAALYGYFRNKDELLLALAADDLTSLARAMRGTGGLAGAGAAALDLLQRRRDHGGGLRRAGRGSRRAAMPNGCSMAG